VEIAAVAVSATDLSRAIAFYEVLGFRFPPPEPDALHVEAEAGIRLMIDAASLVEQLTGEPPTPGGAPGFALLYDSPAEVDEVAGRVAAAGYRVATPPWDAPWGQRYATVVDPDGYSVDLFCPLP
jgi:catechol 2,3-dioxygenase-like lactoylglutathione lyase family enzyme